MKRLRNFDGNEGGEEVGSHSCEVLEACPLSSSWQLHVRILGGSDGHFTSTKSDGVLVFRGLKRRGMRLGVRDMGIHEGDTADDERQEEGERYPVGDGDMGVRFGVPIVDDEYERHG